MNASSSQGRIVILIHLQIFSLLLVTGWFCRRTVDNIVVVFSLELITGLIASEGTSATTTRGSTSTTAVSTSATTTSATTSWLVILFRCSFWLERLFLLLGKLLHFLDLLLQLSATILLEPGLLLLDFVKAIVEIIWNNWSSDAEQSKLLDDDQVQVEGLLILDNLLLLLTLLLSGSTDGYLGSSLTLLLRLGNLNLAIVDLLSDLFLDGLTL